MVLGGAVELEHALESSCKSSMATSSCLRHLLAWIRARPRFSLEVGSSAIAPFQCPPRRFKIADTHHRSLTLNCFH